MPARHLRQKWLAATLWDAVEQLNRTHCQNTLPPIGPLQPGRNVEAYQKARQFWEGIYLNESSLLEVFEACRRCADWLPFTYHNGNTFAAIARKLIEDYLEPLTAVEAQIVRATVGHYVAGIIGKSELLQVFRHFEKAWQQNGSPAAVSPSPATVVKPAPQAS
jgi:hypothetical protein